MYVCGMLIPDHEVVQWVWICRAWIFHGWCCYDNAVVVVICFVQQRACISVPPWKLGLNQTVRHKSAQYLNSSSSYMWFGYFKSHPALHQLLIMRKQPWAKAQLIWLMWLSEMWWAEVENRVMVGHQHASCDTDYEIRWLWLCRKSIKYGKVWHWRKEKSLIEYIKRENCGGCMA